MLYMFCFPPTTTHTHSFTKYLQSTYFYVSVRVSGSREAVDKMQALLGQSFSKINS